MISSLRGRVLEIGLGHCVLEVGGAGLLVQATPSALAGLRRGEEGFLHTSLVVREDSLTLFGFPTAASREVFGLVQQVSGVGPRIALAVVATMEPAALAAAVESEDIKSIQKVPGIGKRTAERMVLDLRGKLEAYSSAAGADSHEPTGNGGSAGDPHADVVEALEGLGFPAKNAASAVAEAAKSDPDSDSAALLRLALAALGPGR